jgi:hypothetical protein
MGLIGLLSAAVLATAAPSALAAPPDNDLRVNATRINPPGTVQGTLEDATVQDNEADSFCDSTDGSVWYKFTAPASGKVIIQFDAAGDLDATVDLYQQERSQLNSIDCESSDKKGSATLDADDLKGEYLIRVSKLISSDPDAFTLKVLVPSPPARPPGKPLGDAAVKDTVDAIANPSDAYSVQMQAGTTYRLSIAARRCVNLSVFAPGTKSFNSDSEKFVGCNSSSGYRLYTPERSGRFPLLVAAGSRERGTLNYRVQVRRALSDDTAPGIFIRNNARVHGHVNGKIDSVDLYRFDVTNRSSLNLNVSGGPTMTLVKPGGRRLDSNTSSISLDVGIGRYYVAVKGKGKYTLRRVSKAITHSRVTFNGSRKAFVGPGQSASLALSVTQGGSGRSTILIEKFDPLDGWQFLRRIHPTVSGGRAALTFSPPSIGRYRATATFDGSKLFSPSNAGQAKLLVRAPLQQR